MDPREFRKQEQRQHRQEEDTTRLLLRLLQASRKSLRERLAQVETDSTSAQMLRAAEAVISAEIDRLNGQMTLKLSEGITQAIELGIDLAEAGLPKVAVPVRFSLPPSLLSTLGEYHAGLVQSVTTNLRGQVTRQVQLGVLGGKTLDQVIADIGASGIRPTGPFRTAMERAEAIARTETNRVPNLAAYERLKAATKRTPGLQKKWVTAGDNRVRESHQKLNGTVIGMDEFFSVGGHQALHPLDLRLPASETVRCRCRLVPVVPEEED